MRPSLQTNKAKGVATSLSQCCTDSKDELDPNEEEKCQNHPKNIYTLHYMLSLAFLYFEQLEIVVSLGGFHFSYHRGKFVIHQLGI
jgi:hypothetical protein